MDLSRYSRTHCHFTTAALPPLLAETARPGVVADLGCGDGSVIRALADQGLLGSTTYAIDVSPERVEIAQGAADGVRPVVADAASVDALPDASVDGVVASQVIEHLKDDRGLVAEIARLLRPGGWWYIGTILRARRAWWIYRVDGVRRLDPTHVREYASESELLRVLSHDELCVDRLAVTKLRYPVSDLALRALGRLRVVAPERMRGAYRSGVPEWVRRVTLPIPGYSLIEVAGHRRAAA